MEMLKLFYILKIYFYILLSRLSKWSSNSPDRYAVAKVPTLLIPKKNETFYDALSSF